MNIRYRVTLSAEERSALLEMVQGGKVAARRMKRAQILFTADLRSTDEQIARNVSVGTSTVYRTKQRFVEEGFEAALCEAPRPGAPRKLDIENEAILCALDCSKPPPGRARWSLQLLAGEMVRLTVHTKVSEETIRRRLGEMQLKPWQEKMWCIPKVDFAECLRDLVDQYYPHAEKIRVVLDNLSAHRPSGCVRMLPPCGSAANSRAPRVSLHA
jgi:transposase